MVLILRPILRLASLNMCYFFILHSYTFMFLCTQFCLHLFFSRWEGQCTTLAATSLCDWTRSIWLTSLEGLWRTAIVWRRSGYTSAARTARAPNTCWTDRPSLERWVHFVWITVRVAKKTAQRPNTKTTQYFVCYDGDQIRWLKSPIFLTFLPNQLYLPVVSKRDVSGTEMSGSDFWEQECRTTTLFVQKSLKIAAHYSLLLQWSQLCTKEHSVLLLVTIWTVALVVGS